MKRQHKRQSSPLQFTISSQDRPHTSKLWCNNLRTFWTFEDRLDIWGLLCITVAFIFHFSTPVDSTANQHWLPTKTCELMVWLTGLSFIGPRQQRRTRSRGPDVLLPHTDAVFLASTLTSTPILLLIMFVPSLTLFTIYHPFFPHWSCSIYIFFPHVFFNYNSSQR